MTILIDLCLGSCFDAKNILVWVAYLSIEQEYDYTYRYVFRKLCQC